MSHAHELYRVFSNGTEIDHTKSHAAAIATLDASVGASVILYGQRMDGKLEPLLEKRNGFRIDPTDLPKRNSRRVNGLSPVHAAPYGEQNG